MKLEYGKSYLTKVGEIRGPLVKNDGDYSKHNQFKCPKSGHTYMNSGRVYYDAPSGEDLTEEAYTKTTDQ